MFLFSFSIALLFVPILIFLYKFMVVAKIVIKMVVQITQLLKNSQKVLCKKESQKVKLYDNNTFLF